MELDTVYMWICVRAPPREEIERMACFEKENKTEKRSGRAPKERRCVTARGWLGA